MNILITGAQGLLGQKLVKLLHGRENVTLLATAHNPRKIFTDVQTECLDITSPEAVRKICKEFRPDWVINAAAMTQVDKCETNREACWEINTNAVRHIVSACHESGSKLIQLSTDFIFRGDKAMLGEEEPPAPVNYYGESKWSAEQIIFESNLHQWVILRTMLVYGRAEYLNRSNIALWVKENLEKKIPLSVVNDQWRTPTLAEDLAQACWLALHRNASGIFHISGEDFMTPYEMALKIAQRFGLDASLITPVTSEQLNKPAQRPMKTGFNIEKAKHELGYRPHRFIEGLNYI